VRAVNGIPAREICEQILARVHGDTRTFRADLASRRFWFFHWKLFGESASYELDVGDPAALVVPGSAELPELLAIEASFERQFHLELLPDHAAVLTLGTFALPDKQPLLDFTRDAFTRLRTAGTSTLVIDVRDNGGGDDVMWIEGVMPYLATHRYRTGSTYRKRVISSDPAKGEVAGSIVDGEIDTWFAPPPGNPLRFKGKTYLLVGAGTYSSAVLFANVLHDFRFGVVAGTGGSVRADQSGGTRRTTLANTGLILVAPRFVLHRPSGHAKPEYLEPEIRMDDAVPATEVARRISR
jgi:C-terminal processing protease CtpA/Prc